MKRRKVVEHLRSAQVASDIGQNSHQEVQLPCNIVGLSVADRLDELDQARFQATGARQGSEPDFYCADAGKQVPGLARPFDQCEQLLFGQVGKLGTRTERYIDKRKIGAVWNKLHEMRGEVQGYEALASVDLTIFGLLTGARRDEMATLQWANVNIDDHDPSNCWWRITDRKRGEDLQMPLSSQAVALLKSRPRFKLADGTESPWVFPSWGKSGRIQDARAPLQVIGEIAGKHLSLHDLRRSFTNYAMRECLVEKFRVDLLTGHAPASDDVTSRSYLSLTNLDWLTPSIQQIGDWIEQQGAVAAAKNVVPLHRAG